jgi:hypothetical protein
MHWILLILMTFPAFSREEFILTLNSSTLGQKNLLLSLDAKARDVSQVSFTKQVSRDNGQIVRIDCLTSAFFSSIIRGELKLLEENQKSNFFLDGTSEVSFPLENEFDSCQYAELKDDLPLVLSGSGQYQNFNINGYNLSLGLFTSTRVIPAQTQTLGRAEFAVTNVKFNSLLGEKQVRFSVTRTDELGTSFLEHGVGGARLCVRDPGLDAQCGEANPENRECHYRCVVTQDNFGCYYCEWE